MGVFSHAAAVKKKRKGWKIDVFSSLKDAFKIVVILKLTVNDFRKCSALKKHCKPERGGGHMRSAGAYGSCIPEKIKIKLGTAILDA